MGGLRVVTEISKAGCKSWRNTSILPIYKQTYDILLRTMTATKDFPREYKYTLGQKMKDELIELVVMIYRANSAADKAQHIRSVVALFQAIQLMMRLSHDIENFDPPPLCGVIEMTDSACANKLKAGSRSSGKGKPERAQVTA